MIYLIGKFTSTVAFVCVIQMSAVGHSDIQQKRQYLELN